MFGIAFTCNHDIRIRIQHRIIKDRLCFRGTGIDLTDTTYACQFIDTLTIRIIAYISHLKSTLYLVFVCNLCIVHELKHCHK